MTTPIKALRGLDIMYLVALAGLAWLIVLKVISQ